jgi:molybdopterin molybdotransferase
MLVEPVRLDTAWRWIEENSQRIDAEEVDLEAARGRTPVGLPRAASDVPATSRAIEDGFALRAEQTVGAGPYNPLSCPVMEAGAGSLPHGAVARVGAGQPLPAGADAILPLEFAEPEGEGRIGILTPLAAGDGVVMAASELRAGDPLWPAGRRCQPLQPAEIGLLSAAGVARVPVVGRPRTRILVAGAPDVLGPMLRALVERDGGAIAEVERLERRAQAGSADLVAGADVVLIAGSLESGLEIAIRGVAIAPGRETCLARLDGTVIALLPTLPAACLWSYELVAGRVVRCRGGRDPGLPYASRRLRASRKIVSGLGFTEVVPVRLDPEDDGAVVPLAGGRMPRLRAAAEADGFTLVPPSSEGCAAGSVVTVWLFEAAAAGDAGRG